MRMVNIAGNRYGMLVAIEPTKYIPGGMEWRFTCDCGVVHKALGANVRLGRTRSCGCTRMQKIAASLTVHGQARKGHRTRLHRAWSMMIDRCSNPHNKSYKYYGAQGVRVCKRWLKFENFLADMSERPSNKHSIDRKNPFGIYSKKNCRWATAKEQANNRRRHWHA